MPLPHRDLPAELAARAFTVEAARMRGLSRSRLSEPDLSVPFTGVRALASAPPTALRLIEAFGLRRPADHIVSHTSALALWGAPLPGHVEKQQRIHVSSLDGITPRANRTVGHTLDPERTLVVTLEPCPMCAGAAWAGRIGRVVFGTPDLRAGATGSLYHLGADPRLNHEFETIGGVRAAECAELLVDFFAARRPSSA